ncbi:MAG: AAA family ATPase [Acidobacteria bacterium]|nr:AAA family ATPase [Acidobacteriota bacterium]
MMPADAYEGAELCDVCGRESCEGHGIPAEGASIDAFGRPASDSAEPRRLIGFSLADLSAHRFPPRRTLLTRADTPILRAGQLMQIFGERGTGKTLFAQSLALVAAGAGHVCGITAPTPCRVLNVDGEMASEDIKDRFDLLTERLGVPLSAPLTLVAADWQTAYLPRLDTQVGQDLIEPFIEAHDLIILDNRSCLFDPEGEKDPTAWQPAQDWLLSLRRRGKAVILVHHANRQGGARGHSKTEDVLDVVLKLARPDDYVADQGARFTASFDKARGVHGAAVAPFTAHLTLDGWQTTSTDSTSTRARLCEYLRLADGAGDRPKSATRAIQGAGLNKQKGLAAWADLKRDGTLQTHPDGGFYVR